MRIGIITQPLANNYGGLLQNYALQTVLKRMGHEPITLDQYIVKPHSLLRTVIRTIKDILKNIIKKVLHVGIPHEQSYKVEKRISTIGANTQRFIDTYINKSPKLYGKDVTYQYCIANNINNFIVGSDQVWRKAFNIRIYNSFLDFAQDINGKKIAYAASFGIDEWEFNKEETSIIRSLIKGFDAVSVRESSGVQLCKQYLNVDAEFVLDPTMLLNQDDYLRLIPQELKTQNKPGRLFTYILDNNPEKQKIIDTIAKDKKLTPFSITVFGDKISNTESVSVEEWLNAFNEAEFVICDSFHAVVFSIIFNKDFLVIANAERGNARFDSILTLFGLQKRLVKSVEEIKKADWQIDWNRVNVKVKEMQNKSMNFLILNLN